MTFKAIELDAGRTVAAGAKMALVTDSNDFPIFARSSMTIDALDQAMLLGANTSTHGFVALVQQVFHVVGTHVRRGFDTLFALRSRHYLAIGIPIRARVLAGRLATK